MTTTYTLSARSGAHIRATRIYADDDTEATYAAMARVLNAAVEDRVWAEGAITLRHNASGRVVQTMPAKSPRED